MNSVRPFTLLLVIGLSLSACGKEDSSNQAAGSASADNKLLTLVPADTPYLAGNVAPVPDAIIDTYLARFEPAIESVQEGISKTRAEWEANPEDRGDDPAERIALSLLEELDGKLNRAGLESLGFDLSAEHVIYGMSAFPIIRTSLSDAGTLRATVQRIMDRAKVDAPAREYQGQSYWRIAPGDHGQDQEGSNSDSPDIAIYIAILQDHLALGILPQSAEANLLPAFLALEKPANSMASSRLQEINQRFGYTPYGTGVLDIQDLVDEFLDASSLAGKLLAESGHDLSSEVTDQCRSEISSIIQHTPRIYSGVKELSEDALSSQFVVETESSIATQLIGLVSDVPQANSSSSYLAELALGLRVGAVRDFLREKAMAVLESPYQCEHLLKLNDHAQQASDQLNQPVPPLVNNLLGLRVAISQFGSDMSDINSSEGLIALHVSQPEMLVGMAQMLVPNLAELNLAPGEPPVLVPEEIVPVPGLVLYAAQSKSAIGLSVGEGQQAGLPDYLGQQGKTNGTFLSANYDTASYMEVTGKLGAYADDSKDHPMAIDIARDIQEAIKAVSDRTDTRVSFTKDGFVVDSRMSFKDP